MRAFGLPAFVERQPAQVPRRAPLAAGIGDLVMLAEHFRHPFGQGGGGIETGREPFRVRLVEVHRRMAVNDAMGQGHARAAAGRHPHRVHAAAEEEPPRLCGLSEQERAVRRETFRPVEQHFYLRVFKHGEPVQGVHHHRLEMVPVFRQQPEGEVVTEPAWIDRLAGRLEAADEQAAGIVPDIEVAVVVRQCRQVALDVVDGPCQQVEMLAWPDRNPDIGHGGHIPAPQPGTERDRVAPHRASLRLDADDASGPGQDAGDTDPFENSRAPGPGAPGQGGAKIGRADPAVVGRPDRTEDVRHVHERPALLRLPDRNGARADTEDMGQGLLPPDMGEPVPAGGDGQRPLVDPARRLAGLRFQPGIQGDGIADEVGEITA